MQEASRRNLPKPAATEVLSASEHARADAASPAYGANLSQLMEAAGAAVARVAAALGPARPTLVLAGPGNNGGDGYVAARLLAEQGWPVRAAVLSDPRPGGEAAAARAAWTGETAPLRAGASAGAGLVIDALFGAGLARPLEGAAAAMAEEVRHSGATVLAVDVPSGVEGDTGLIRGPAFRADATATFLRLKPGHLIHPGRAACGAITLADIGHPPEALAAVDAKTFDAASQFWLAGFPWPGPGAHKHARGRLGVVTGGAAHTGAARLAARAGLRAGAGLVTLYAPPSALMVVAIASTAVMTESFKDAAALAGLCEEAHAVVIGPAAGVSADTRANVEALLAGEAALVLDADALTVFADAPGALFDRLTPRHVLTPHLGEFRRLFPDLDPVAIGPLAAARQAAARAGAVVLLKGASTIVAHPGGRAAINAHATPFLATAGSGDVLAGLIGGLLAQGMGAFEAASAAAWIHGEAALGLGPGLIAEDLTEAIPRVLKGLFASARL